MPRASIGVVGFGYWGSHHVRVLSELLDASVTIIEPSQARRDEAGRHYPHLTCFESLSQASETITGVVVATPPTTHYAVARQALMLGKGVLVEKPFTTTTEQALDLIEMARQEQLTLLVGHTFLYHDAFKTLRQLIAQNDLGKILHIHASRFSLGKFRDDVDVMWDLAVHDLSMIMSILAEVPEAVSVHASRKLATAQADLATLNLEFPASGATETIVVSWINGFKTREMTIVGDKRIALYDYTSETAPVRIKDASIRRSTEELGSWAYRLGDEVVLPSNNREPLLVQDEHFLDCLELGVPAETAGIGGAEVVAVMEAAGRSSRSRQWETVGALKNYGRSQ